MITILDFKLKIIDWSPSMISSETLKRIRYIEIQTRRLLNGGLVGDSRSAVKGSGFEFDQIRDYQPGDDVRFIDWKSSSRMNKLLIKQYREERSRCIMLALDVSNSGLYSSGRQTKYDVMAEIAAVMSLVADYGKDRVALLLFAGDVEHYVPPHRGRTHVMRIMQAIFEYKITGKNTRFKPLLERIAKLKQKDALVILISDFIDIDHEHGVDKVLMAAGKMNEILAIRCLDQYEIGFEKVGFLTLEDLETGERCLIDARTRGSKRLGLLLQERVREQASFFKRYAIDCLDVAPDKPFMTDIVRFFRQRVSY